MTNLPIRIQFYHLDDVVIVSESVLKAPILEQAAFVNGNTWQSVPICLAL